MVVVVVVLVDLTLNRQVLEHATLNSTISLLSLTFYGLTLHIRVLVRLGTVSVDANLQSGGASRLACCQIFVYLLSRVSPSHLIPFTSQFNFVSLQFC